MEVWREEREYRYVIIVLFSEKLKKTTTIITKTEKWHKLLKSVNNVHPHK